MDVEQTLVFRLGETMGALDRILLHLDESRKCLSKNSFHRLVAYELMACPEVLNYNDMVRSQDGRVYMQQNIAWTHAPVKKGYFVLRAPFLELVALLLRHYRKDWKNAAFYGSMTGAIVSAFPQRQCCWYNVSKKKACACEAKSLETQKGQAYVFCLKHWSPVLRQETAEDTSLCPPSEMNLDDWLQTIV